jgi:hypothetical protein
MRTAQELTDLVMAAAAYDVVMRSDDGSEEAHYVPRTFFVVIKRLLTDRDFRAVAADAWSDLFRDSGKPTGVRAAELYREIEDWTASRRPPEFLSALDTDDTPPVSKT